ncbi:hypothetical protein [Campylobacter ureolyticus]|uniref:Uncharacterized protein n=1 Tax=Campylobacter ureolyticus TaxID=827 RepID=A0A9Q4PW04_9BACT|nr:hypothetical protein [Campylobacter ureolyticus]MCZ6104066.1 hypothetical protein [Campylobacter ureolyticus]MCZ6135488.1 hypothetical protein [Campylobacter ureolyticus]MCZ6162444.1 hypothetical protein [Campylobacter ureolyticus]MCZ6171369.1 hypothetical protein [Campylobacter ureolyticus]MDU4981526.1 hypothetical protein [Campylobacter ureolyticus]
MYELILTAYGLESLTNLEKVNLSSVVVGSGEIEPSLTTTALKEPKATVLINDIKKYPKTLLLYKLRQIWELKSAALR